MSMIEMSSASLYDDHNVTSGLRSREDVKLLKRTMTLDFNGCPSSNKKGKFNKNIVLESPDLKMLKLASPDLERMIIANGMVTTTPTPSGGLSHYFLKSEDATEEQMEYARGFVDALNQLHETNGHHNGHTNGVSVTIANHNSSSSDSSADLTIADAHNHVTRDSSFRDNLGCNIMTSAVTSTVNTNTTNGIILNPFTNANNNQSHDFTNGHDVNGLPSYSAAVNNAMYPMTIKIESQTSDSPHPPSMTTGNTTIITSSGMTPPLSPSPHTVAPIDMADQERIKLERKRLRNRIAASKCRRRKLERISRLEDKVKNLKGENAELGIVVNKLRDQVCGLKQQVMEHVKIGCQLMMPQ